MAKREQCPKCRGRRFKIVRVHGEAFALCEKCRTDWPITTEVAS